MSHNPLFRARGHRRSSASARKRRQVTFSKAPFKEVGEQLAAMGDDSDGSASPASRSGSSVSSASEGRIAAIAAAQLRPLQQTFEAHSKRFEDMMTHMQLQTQLLTEARDAERLKARG